MNVKALYERLENWVSQNDEDKTLDLSGLRLKRLPNFENLPPEFSKLKNLIRLNCKDNIITEIDSSELPSKLEYLDCSYNRLTYIPELPENLTTLICSNNEITGLPNLPKYLGTLICSYNNLETLEGVSSSNLPESLTYLDCSYNKIKRIYEVPTFIKIFIIKGNPIKESIKFGESELDLNQYINLTNDDIESDEEMEEIKEITNLINEGQDILIDDGEEIKLFDRNYIIENVVFKNKSYKIDNLKLSPEKYKELLVNDFLYLKI
jgi:Leucine-rich repeat (LRR) protein